MSAALYLAADNPDVERAPISQRRLLRAQLFLRTARAELAQRLATMPQDRAMILIELENKIAVSIAMLEQIATEGAQP
jgi:hypothetical protein